MAVHDPQVYKDLLYEFRVGWAQFSKVPLFLIGLTNKELSTLSEAEQQCHFERLGLVEWVTICTDRKNIGDGFWVWAASSFGGEDATELAIEAFECFRPLANLAGAALPLGFQIPQTRMVNGAGDRWYDLLWWTRVLREAEPDPPAGQPRCISFSPFEDSIWLIDICGLTTETPCVPYTVRFEPTGQDDEYMTIYEWNSEWGPDHNVESLCYDVAKVHGKNAVVELETPAHIEPVDNVTTSGGATPPDPPLCEREQLVLKVLLNGKAFDSDHRITTKEVAEKAVGRGTDANQFKQVIVKLAKPPLKYVNTKEGRGGGCWLTLPGMHRAKKL